MRPLTAGTLPRGAGRVIPALVHLGASLVQEPPPRGDLSGGIWSAPAWVIGGLGGLIVLGAVAAVVGRAIFLTRRREREDRAPRSRRRW